MADIEKKAGKLAAKLTEFTHGAFGKAIMIAGGIVAAGAVANEAIQAHNHSIELKHRREQERGLEEKQSKLPKNFDSKLYYDIDRLSGIPQQLYNNRNNHSNSWGGRRY